MLVGLTILIASVSLFCYRYPPRFLSFVDWLRRQPAILPDADARGGEDAPREIAENNESRQAKDVKRADENVVGGERKVVKSEDENELSRRGQGANIGKAADGREVLGQSIEDLRTADAKESFQNGGIKVPQDLIISKETLDRKLMPPPPSKKTSSTPASLTPRATLITTPSLALDDRHNSSYEPQIPSFPAANSAQRASGGVRGPPSLKPPPSQASSLMPPPSRTTPLPNRSPSSSGLAPPPTHTTIPAKPRKKVLLTPGHSPLDWARLSSSPSSNLRGLPPTTPLLHVPPSLLRQFTGRKGKDAWTILGGKVYNITPYIPYHPGGEAELMKCAGRDGTRLFGEVHPWVNWEGMLEGCLVGVGVDEGDVREGGLEEMD